MALILIVDDSPTEVHVMQKALERHGYRTAWAGDGAEGIRLARQIPDAEKAARADFVIENTGDLAALRARVRSAWQQLKSESNKRPSRGSLE